MKKEIETGSLEFGRALAAASDEEIRKMLERISSLDVHMVREPETGLIMQTVSDCFKTDFHPGEILVTVAEVILDGRRGWGMVMGDDSDRATLAACLDVIMTGGTVPVKEEITRLLAAWQEKSAAMIAEQARLHGTTRVHFESMAEEKSG